MTIVPLPAAPWLYLSCTKVVIIPGFKISSNDHPRLYKIDNFASVADLVGLGVQITGYDDSELRDKALAMTYQNIGSTKAIIDMLSEGDDYPEIVNLREEVSDWVSTFKVPWDGRCNVPTQRICVFRAVAICFMMSMRFNKGCLSTK